MKPIVWFSAFFLASSLFFTGCYTHIATTGNGYYVYHPRPIYSDTLRPNSPKEIVTYDTTMHGDTMFIDEHRVEGQQQGNGLTENLTPNENATTIVNNYYGSASYWDAYWGPSWGVSVGYGWPYYSTWYSPWWPYYYTPNYYTDWWAPYGYFGYYPPVYNCYAGYYGFGYPYYPYYGGYGYHHHHFFADQDEHGYGYYDNLRPGRIGGEARVGQATVGQRAPGVMATNPAGPSVVVGRSSLAEVNAGELAQSRAAEVLQSASDRNAPVHVLSPDAESARSTAPAANVPTTQISTAPNSLGTTSLSRTVSSHPIVVRRMDNGQTVTTSTMNRAGRETVVIRRSSGSNAEASYRSSFGGNGSAPRGSAPSDRGSRNYSAPARSYSPPARNYSPPEQNTTPREPSYSPPERSSSPPERSAPADGGARSNGGGSEGRAGGGEGRAR